MDLSSHVSSKELFALNAQTSTPVTSLLLDNADVCRSDCDSQMLITFTFTEAVRLSAVAFITTEGEEPTVMKLWLDKREIAFEDVERTKPSADVPARELEKMRSGAAFQLPLSKFPPCNSVTVFLDAEGKDTVALSRLVFFGSTMQCTDITKMSACCGQKLHPNFSKVGGGGGGGAEK